MDDEVKQDEVALWALCVHFQVTGTHTGTVTWYVEKGLVSALPISSEGSFVRMHLCKHMTALGPRASTSGGTKPHSARLLRNSSKGAGHWLGSSD